MDGDRRLSRDELDAVVRRATQLAARESDASERLSEAEVLRIGREVGLAERHLRTALGELRSGALGSGRPRGLLDRFFGPSSVRGRRLVLGEPEELISTVDTFLLGGKLLQRVRESDRELRYRPSVDWISQIARSASLSSGRHYIACAHSVDLRVDPGAEAGACLIELEVDPGTRTDAVVGGFLGAVAAGLAVGVGIGALAWTSGIPMALSVTLGLASGTAALAGVVWAVGRLHMKKVDDVVREVEEVLRRLDEGEELEPPTAGWRRWVERQFHGARRLIDSE